MLDWLRTRLRQAGAPSEDATDRDGAFSFHAETHAAGVGAGLGFAAVATGNVQWLALLLPAVTAGLRARQGEFGKILADVRQEPHYALGGLVAGALLGLAVRLTT
jgi:hypothetical protein